jgi:hypothetical protein
MAFELHFNKSTKSLPFNTLSFKTEYRHERDHPLPTNVCTTHVNPHRQSLRRRLVWSLGGPGKRGIHFQPLPATCHEHGLSGNRLSHRLLWILLQPQASSARQLYISCWRDSVLCYRKNNDGTLATYGGRLACHACGSHSGSRHLPAKLPNPRANLNNKKHLLLTRHSLQQATPA